MHAGENIISPLMFYLKINLNEDGGDVLFDEGGGGPGLNF